jgi:hypothetical protein
MSDIFGLGVLILEVITGQKGYPYDIRTNSTEFIELVRKICKFSMSISQKPCDVYHCIVIFPNLYYDFTGTSKMEKSAAKGTRVHIS